MMMMAKKEHALCVDVLFQAASRHSRVQTHGMQQMNGGALLC